MKVGLIVQRYGLDVAGGAELHCRLVAEHLINHHAVEVFTTCAQDYVTWKNHYPAGSTIINGVPVHRYRVKRGRNIRTFEDVQNLVFHQRQSPELEHRWLRENGPWCPKLVKEVRQRSDIDAWVLFSYRYWTTSESLRVLGSNTLLVPTAEHDPALYLGVVSQLFKSPGAIAYNSHEEKNLIQSISGNSDVPGDIVGVGLVESEVDGPVDPKIDQRFKDLDPYILYIGRIDKNKGCDHLFRMFQRFCTEEKSSLNLALIGKTVMPVPEHPQIQHLGFLSEAEKAAALRHCRLLIMPSQFESLSMVLLEAWQFSRPALVNGKCEVLAGQCERSNGGLAYMNYDEFAAFLTFLIDNPHVAETMGKHGHNYYSTHYNWQVIESKFDRLLQRVSVPETFKETL